MSCHLRIEIEEPTTTRCDGAAVSGTVVVTTTAAVSCRGLEITSYWCTHGLGNVDRGIVDKCDVFQGEWDANREYRYPFRLSTAAWPPTYYGTHLNVSHYVGAQAKVPWAKDPRAEAEFPVVATRTPDELQPTRLATGSKSRLAWLLWPIGVVFVAVFGAMFAVMLLFLVPLAAAGAAFYWFMFVVLPKRITGPVECTVEPLRVAPNGVVQGRLRFTPQRQATINAIGWSVLCQEKCTSGSGSNRSTHRCEVFQRKEQLFAGGELQTGVPQSFDFAFEVPESAAPSLKLSDNELTWELEVRIDIPRWPDWSQRFALIVGPDGTGAAPAGIAEGTDTPSAESDEPDAWFDQVVQQVLQSRHDSERMRRVIEAVRDEVFTIRVDLLGMQPPPLGRNGDDSGTWVRARHRAHDVSIALRLLEDEMPPAPTRDWIGTARLLAFDESNQGLVMERHRTS